MRRLALGAVLGAVAFGASFDSMSPGAATAALRSRQHRTVKPAAPPQPSAADDLQAMAEAVGARRAVGAAADDRADRGGSPAAARRGADDRVWRALGACESNNDPRAVSASGTYRGAFQFSTATWRSLGYAGDPIDHSYATQLEAARRLQRRSGWDQWPACARRLGLR